MKPKQYIVYALSHPITDEVRYIGKSESGIDRPRQHGHLSHLKKKAHLPSVRWISKLKSQGLDYKIETVEECDSRELLMEAEKFWIAQFRGLGFRLLNICDGGEGFTGHHTDESKEKIRQSSTGRLHTEETRTQMSKNKSGVPLSETHKKALRKPKSSTINMKKSPETRAKMSQAQNGRKMSPESVMKMAKSKGARPFRDQHGTIYLTQSEAGRAIGAGQGSVRQVLKGKSKQTKGYRFSYL